MKGRGCDCGSFLAAVLAEAGALPQMEMPKYDWCGPWARGDRWYEELVEQHCLRLDPRMAAAGDIVLYRMGRGFAHGALVADWPQAIIHADRHFGVVMCGGKSGRLAGHESRIYRLKEVAC